MMQTFATSLSRHVRNCSRPALGLVALAALAFPASVTANTTAPPANASAGSTIVAGVMARSGKLVDARLMGPSGQIYAAVNGDPLRWRRVGLGGIASTVSFAGNHNGSVFAAGKRTPIYVLKSGVWHAKPLPNRGRASLSSGGRIGAASVGRQVYTLHGTQWRRFGKTRGRVTAVFATSATTVYASNTAGRLRRGRKAGKTASWSALRTRLPRGDFVVKLIAGAGKQLFAISQQGALLRIRGTRASRVTGAQGLRGMVVHALSSGPTSTYVAGRLSNGTNVVARLDKGRLAHAAPVPGMGRRDRVATLIQDAQGRLVVATRAGRLVVRDQKNSWQAGTIEQVAGDTTPNRFGGAAPARTQ